MKGKGETGTKEKNHKCTGAVVYEHEEGQAQREKKGR
jgi:hypothetical protein